MKYITVRVVQASGGPKSGAKVTAYLRGIDAGAFAPQYTNSEGVALFALNIEDSHRLDFTVDGKEMVTNERPQASFTFICP